MVTDVKADSKNSQPELKAEVMDIENNETYPFADKREAGRSSVRRCANCDIEILWPPFVHSGQTYCCAGCAAGGPCTCDYSQYSSVHISGVIHYLPKSKQQ